MFSTSHLLILLAVVLIFGARRLPEVGGALGSSLRNFKRALEGKDESEEKKKLASKPEENGSSKQSG